jgi:hypothetical protein
VLSTLTFDPQRIKQRILDLMPVTRMPILPEYQGYELDENMVVPQFVVGDQYTTSMLL